MKLKSILASFLAIIMLLFVDTVSAATVAPKTFKVNGSDLYVIDTNKYLPGGTWNFYFKKNADGQIIYCVQSHDSSVTSGSHNYTLVKEMESKYAYVLANGYPNKSITGNAEKDYFITAFAIYYLVDSNDYIFTNFDFDKGTYRGSESIIVKEVAKLINGAKNYSYVNPSININSNNSFTLSNDGKYYVSSNMGVSTVGTVSNYTVSLENAPSGTIITDLNGTKKNTFGSSEKFLVKVPVSKIKNLSNTFKVNVSAEGNVKKAYLYEPDDAKYQNVTTLYTENKKLNDSASVKLDLTTKVSISKIDITNNKELPGATLTIKDSNGKVINTWVSGNEPKVIENLPVGKYTLTEDIAPKGYKLSTETITFEVKADGNVTKVVMKNEITVVQISKVDATTGNELPGAKLTVKDSNGKVVDSWISTNEVHKIEKLPAGKYTLTEEVAPEGYKLSTETVEFIVNKDGTVNGKVVMKNIPKDKTPIFISKQDITTSEELTGAHLELKDSNGNVIEAWVSSNEPHMIEELKPGKYFLTEVLAPEGYELSSETVEFTVKEDGTVDGNIIMYNKPETIVEVPSTSSFKTITASLIGIIVIGLGSMMIYKNYKKNEEY